MSWFLCDQIIKSEYIEKNFENELIYKDTNDYKHNLDNLTNKDNYNNISKILSNYMNEIYDFDNKRIFVKFENKNDDCLCDYDCDCDEVYLLVEINDTQNKKFYKR